MQSIYFEIDRNSKVGKYIIPLLKELSETNKGINLLSDEEAEDRILELMMEHSAKSGIAPQKRVLSKLGIQSQ